MVQLLHMWYDRPLSSVLSMAYVITGVLNEIMLATGANCNIPPSPQQIVTWYQVKNVAA